MITNFTDHASNERTFLAWVRTSIAIMGFGLAAARLGSQQTAVWTEALLLIAGAVVILIAYIRMRRLRTLIEESVTLDNESMPKDSLLLLLVASLFALLGIFALHIF